MLDIFLIQKHDTYTEVYDDVQRNGRAAYEMAHYLEYGSLPDDAYVIERVEEINGSRLWLHYPSNTELL